MAALVAAVVVYALVSLPPKRRALSTPSDDATVAGVLHVHTNRSDGRSSPDEIAAAASRAGLKFLVFTDHGDATRTPDPPTYRSGVLCLDGVEISTNGGHYIAIDMPATPYPLAGEARDVVEDVHRLGGFGIAAHPDSPKRELRWREWDAPFDGVELINPDTSWRVHAARPGIRAKLRLLTALLTYPARESETIAALLAESASAIRQWHAITIQRRVVATSGVDAHAKLELKNVDPGDNRYSVPLPSYDASFHVLSVRVRPEAPLTGDAAADAHQVLRAIRGGHLYSVVDGWASPPSFQFTLTNRGGTAQQGDEVVENGAATLHVRSNAPDGYTTRLWQATGDVWRATQQQNNFDVEAGDTPAVFRVEIRAPGHPDAPAWITSNPIYVRSGTSANAAAAAQPFRAAENEPLFDGRALSRWNTEADQTSLAALDVAPRLNGSEVRLRYGLGGGTDTGQFAAATVATVQGVGKYDRLTFTIRAERPMRVSVQVRAEVKGAAPERWQRSIYVDDQDRERSVLFSDMTPVGQTHAQRAPLGDVRSVLFIVDTTNTKPGTSGRVWIRNPRLEK